MNEIVEIMREIKPEIDIMGCGNYIENGILDSFDILVLVSAIDESFNISIDGADIIPENFGSIEAIFKMVGKYREIQ